MAGRLGMALFLEPVLRIATYLRIDIGLYYMYVHVVWGRFSRPLILINRTYLSTTVRLRERPRP